MFGKLFYMFEHLFILVEDRPDKILSFCVFVSPGDVTFLSKRGTRLERRVWEHCLVFHVVPRYFYRGLSAYHMVVIREKLKDEITFWSRAKSVALLCHAVALGKK